MIRDTDTGEKRYSQHTGSKDGHPKASFIPVISVNLRYNHSLQILIAFKSAKESI